MSYLKKPLEDSELSQIIDTAYDTSLLIREGLTQQQRYYQHVQSAQNALSLLNKQAFAAMAFDIDLPHLHEKVLSRIDKEQHGVDVMNQHIKTLVDANPNAVDYHWPLYTHKMSLILAGAKNLLADESTFRAMVQGELPEHLNNTPPDVIFLQDATQLYGNSQLSFLTSALISTQLTLLGEDSKIQDIPFSSLNNWIDTSPVLHVVPLFDAFASSDIFTASKASSFFYSDDITPHGFAYIHSGYAFGGHRFEARYPEGKIDGPEDCSSWLAKMLGSETLFSTIDLLYTYRMSFEAESRGYVHPDWQHSEYSQTQALLTPVHVADPFTDIHPGQVMALRHFDDATHTGDGTGGHTGLVMGVRENGQILLLSYARTMPTIEGFGLLEFPWASDEHTETMFFEVNQPMKAFSRVEDGATCVPHILDAFDSAALSASLLA